MVSIALKYTTSLVVAIYNPLQTVAGIIIAIIFINEMVTIRVICGGIGILLGMCLVLLSKRWEEKNKVVPLENEKDKVVPFEDENNLELKDGDNLVKDKRKPINETSV